MNTLVVVDDEPAFAEFVAAVASAATYTVDTFDAVAAFRRHLASGWPSVLVMDLQMPGSDGIELLRELGQQGCTSKIILLSGTDARVLDAAFRLGAATGLSMAAKLSKPVRAQELKEILVDLLSKEIEPTAEALAGAINEDRLFLLFQPKVSIPTRRMIGVEALVRWRSNTGRVILPSTIIPLAEASGLIDRLTWWVVESAFRQTGDWLRKGLDLHLAVNLSAGNIHDRQLPDQLADLCASFGVEPERITLELTETASTQDHITLLEVLGRFRIKGFHLSIDDFGTGFSSVTQLLRLPFSELKVDRSFVSEMDRVHEAAVVTKTLIHMTHDLGLAAVAEGVENKACLDLLSKWGCDIAQGYYFSKPVEAAAIEAMAATPSWMQ
ncbi:MAG: EAL domain-containing protein [Acidobacteriota bacterium]